MMASCKDRSVSSMNCSEPPLRISVQVLAWWQPVNTLYLGTIGQTGHLMHCGKQAPATHNDRYLL